MAIAAHSIKFGTDGWRGRHCRRFHLRALGFSRPCSGKSPGNVYGDTTSSNTIIVGYDRRFMAEDFAKKTAEVVQAAGFDVMLSEGYAPTPAFSWAAKQQNALGALVITASHNPGNYLGLKVKGAFGGSVAPEITQQIEALLDSGT
jgi:phosphomannomutase